MSLNDLSLSRSEALLPLQFHPCRSTLTDGAAVYWKMVLARSAKVGVEIEVVNPPGTLLEDVMEDLQQRLRPSKDNRRFGDYGVLTISRELVGLEVKVIGRVPIFANFLGLLRSIYRQIGQTGCEPDGHCGMHQHLIAVQLGEDVPPIILANLWNLTRWYAPALRFLTSAGPTRDQLTRRRCFCDHAELMRRDASDSTMHQIAAALSEAETIKEHNNFLNLEHLAFRPNGNIQALHFEYRFPDMDLSPISATAKCFLATVILLRAVELSKYGVLRLDPERLARRAELLDRLSNADGEEPMSDTRAVDDQQFSMLQRQTMAMMTDLKPVFTFFDPKVFKVLSILARSPVSILRHHGNTWEEIDNIFSSAILSFSDHDSVAIRLIQMIELFELNGSESEKEWIQRAAAELDVSAAYLRVLLADLGHRRSVQWDPDLQTMIFHY